MPDTSPTPVDRCASRYQPSPVQCALDAHTSGRHVNKWRQWEDEDALARASIGPDSERIRELEAENAKLDEALTEELTERDRLTDLLDQFAYSVAPLSKIGEHTSANDPWANALDLLANRAAGLLPGPDDIVVSREDVRLVVHGGAEDQTQLDQAVARLAAALSQPHPVQEGTS